MVTLPELSTAVALALLADMALGFAFATWWIVRRENAAAERESVPAFEAWKARVRGKRRIGRGGRWAAS